MNSDSVYAEAPAKVAYRHVRAWLILLAALALHVIDEALTGFLDFYNPLVLDLRARFSWFPMPTFTFGVWIIGLGVLIILLALLTPAVRRGAAGTRTMSWSLVAIMSLNGFGHLGGSLYAQEWLPGSTSAPLLLVGSALLARATWLRRRAAGSKRGSPPGPAPVSGRIC